MNSILFLYTFNATVKPQTGNATQIKHAPLLKPHVGLYHCIFTEKSGLYKEAIV